MGQELSCVGEDTAQRVVLAFGALGFSRPRIPDRMPSGPLSWLELLAKV